MISIFFILSLFTYNEYITTHSIDEIRILYQKSATEEVSCNKLITILQAYNENNNSLLAGYKACATMIMAKYKFNPFIKLSNFIEGRNLLENCINVDKENIELRYLRFTIQNNAPTFLNYHHSIQADKLVLLNSISTLQDLQLKNIITSYLMTSNLLTQVEKQNLKT